MSRRIPRKLKKKFKKLGIKYELYWYCQSWEESTGKCEKQCHHCKRYYKGFPSDGHIVFN